MSSDPVRGVSQQQGEVFSGALSGGETNCPGWGCFCLPLQAMAQEEPVCTPESMGSEDMLFLLYTSGSTGKPKGLVHTQAGYLLFAAMTHKVRPWWWAQRGQCSPPWWDRAGASGAGSRAGAPPVLKQCPWAGEGLLCPRSECAHEQGCYQSWHWSSGVGWKGGPWSCFC